MSKPIKKKTIKVVCRICNGSGEVPDTRVGKKTTDTVPCGSCNGNKKKFKNNRNKPPKSGGYLSEEKFFLIGNISNNSLNFLHPKI